MRTLVFLAALATTSQAVDNWPQFRGPGAMGVADDPKLPDSWSETENVVWKTEIPGRGATASL